MRKRIFVMLGILFMITVFMVTGNYSPPSRDNVGLSFPGGHVPPSRQDVTLVLGSAGSGGSGAGVPADTCTYPGSGDWFVNLIDNCTPVNTSLSGSDKIIISGGSGLFKIGQGIEIRSGGLSLNISDFNGDSRFLIESGGRFGIIT